MIYILSWTTKKHQKNLSRPLHSKLKKIQGLFKDLHRNLRTFQGLPFEFKDFPRLREPCKSRRFVCHAAFAKSGLQIKQDNLLY